MDRWFWDPRRVCRLLGFLSSTWLFWFCCSGLAVAAAVWGYVTKCCRSGSSNARGALRYYIRDIPVLGMAEHVFLFQSRMVDIRAEDCFGTHQSMWRLNLEILLFSKITTSVRCHTAEWMRLLASRTSQLHTWSTVFAANESMGVAGGARTNVQLAISRYLVHPSSSS